MNRTCKYCGELLTYIDKGICRNCSRKIVARRKIAYAEAKEKYGELNKDNVKLIQDYCAKRERELKKEEAKPDGE